jgi:hypothetical protein
VVIPPGRQGPPRYTIVVVDGGDVIHTSTCTPGEDAEAGFSADENIIKTMFHIVEFAEEWAGDYSYIIRSICHDRDVL